MASTRGDFKREIINKLNAETEKQNAFPKAESYKSVYDFSPLAGCFGLRFQHAEGKRQDGIEFAKQYCGKFGERLEHEIELRQI